MADVTKPDPKEAAKLTKYEPPKELEQKAAVQKFVGRPKRQPVDQAEYFYEVKKTHIVFFASSLLLLIGFLLMFRKDDHRDWKQYQAQFAAVDFEKLRSEILQLRKESGEDQDRIQALEQQVESFVRAFKLRADKGETVPITLLDPEAPLQSPRLQDEKARAVHIVVDPDRKKLKVREADEIEGEWYLANQRYNFAKDELGSVRFVYESAKHHFDEAKKTGDDRLTTFEAHLRDAEKKFREAQEKVVATKRAFDALDRQKAFYVDFAAALEKGNVPGIWEVAERLTQKDVEDCAALAKDARVPDAAKKVFETLARAYAVDARRKDLLDGLARNPRLGEKEKALVGTLLAGKGPADTLEVLVLEKMALPADVRFSAQEKELLAGIGRPKLTEAERRAIEPLQGEHPMVRRVLNRSLEALKEEVARLRKEIADREARFAKERPTLPNVLRNKPMLDFIDPTLKVRQVIVEDIKDQLNFTAVTKVDRCHTCHVGIDKPGYEVWIDRTAERETDRYVFKDPFLRTLVAHATGGTEEKDCRVCADAKASEDKDMPPAQVKHGAWTSDDAVKFTKAFMAHPRLDLYVSDSSKHPIGRFGCTVCHEGDGRDTHFGRVVHIPDDQKEGLDWKRRHGVPFGEEHYNWNYRELWDLPMIQSKFLQASCRRCHKGAVELDGGQKYVEGMKLFERAGCYGCHRTESYLILDKDKKNPETPEQVKARRPGPPLTRLPAKVDEAWTKKWILGPRDFRPTTRMPHFFNLSNTRTKVNGNPYPIYTDKQGRRRSPVDDALATALTKYIFTQHADAKADPAPPSAVKGDPERGRLIVHQVGCMACHKTEDTPVDVFAKWTDKSRYLTDFGPSLAGVGSKITSKAWLYAWVRDPKAHFPDSAMPSLRLSEQEAMDVVEYLMTLKNPDFDKDPGPPAPDKQLVDDLVLEQLRARMPEAEALRRVKGEAKLADFASPDAKLVWLGREMVKNYGCYSCHELKRDGDLVWADMEGIGVELTGAQPWGIKHWDRLDFGYLADDNLAHHGATFKHQFTGEPITKSIHKTRQEWLKYKLENPRVYDGGKMDSKPWDELLRMPHFAFTPYEIELLQTFVLSFTDHEVAGLVENVKHRPDAKDQWLSRGQRIARDNNCAGCHRLSLDRFEVEWTRVDPKKDKVVSSWEWAEAKAEKATSEQAVPQLRRWGLIGEGQKADGFEVYKLTPAVHHRTMQMPPFAATAQFAVFDGRDWSLLDVDEKGREVVRPVRRHVPQDGGDVIDQIAEFKREANRVYVKAREQAEKDLEKRIAELKKTDPKKADELDENFEDEIAKLFPANELFKQDPGQYEVRFPPMLRTQGVKTQADWTFSFLKNPWPIRPNLHPVKPGAPTMPDRNIRMPSFGLADEEAASLVRWFAARDHLQGVDVYPHTPIPQKEAAAMEAHKDVHAKLLTVVRDNQKGCAQCHWVNGQAPPGDPYKHAPELGNVQDRIRPRWLKSWVEAPATVYPGAVMLPAGEVVPGFKEMNRQEKDATLDRLVEILMNLKRLDAKPTGKAN